jgi:hypothetical protein
LERNEGERREADGCIKRLKERNAARVECTKDIFPC